MKRIFFLLTTTILTLTVTAQTNFSGSWKLKEKQHILGPEYANAIADAVRVKQTKDSLITETSSTNAEGGEVKSRQSLPMNGNKISTVSATSGRKVTRSLSWSKDKTTLTVTSDIYKEGDGNEIELTRIDTWTLSPDGKQFTLHRKSVETTSENWETKGIYAKE